MGVVGRLDQYASMLAWEFDEYSMSENLLTYSEQFDTGTWTKSTVTLTPNVTTAPDGTLTADLLVEDTSTNVHWITYATAPYTTNTYTFSIFAKQGVGSRYLRFTGFGLSAVSENAIFDISSGIVYSPPTTTVLKSASIIPYPNGWYRCICNIQYSGTGQRPFFGMTDSTTNFGVYSYTGNGTSGFYIWGVQLEYGSVATDYTPTTTTAINRVLASTTNTNITGLGTYYSSGFYENVGFTTFLPANVFAPYDPVYDEFSGTSFGAGQGRYMRQNTDKSVIVYNEIDEITDFRDIVRSGLVLDLDAGMNSSFNNTGRTTWTDLSGIGNNGTLVLGPTYSSSNQGSIVFDGSNDYITSSFSTTSGQAVTYCGWLYSTETTATYRNFVDSVTANPMIWWNTTGQIEFDAANWTTAAVYRNQWVYVALSKPSGNSSASYYVNGVLVGTGGAYTTPAVTPTWFNRAAGQTWKGNCSTVQVYNRALTAAEITQNYNALKNRYGL